jgi:LmbE family N-acetylglucosaminyl deacetylase
MAKVAVVSPHLDDAVLSAWSVLHQALVISCFAGYPAVGVEGSWDARSGLSTGRSAMDARRAEDLSALRLTQSEAVHLDLLDEQYRQGAPAAVGELTALLSDVLADIEEVWLPAGIGRHRDHTATRQAALAATKSTQRRFLYADLPYAGQPAWPADLTGALRDRVIHRACAAFGLAQPEQEWRSVLAEVVDPSPGEPRVVRLTPHQSRQKWEAVTQYRSQLAPLKCGRSHPLRRRRIFAYEVHWPLPAQRTS